MIELNSDRLLLRQWRRDDFEPVAAFLRDPVQTKHFVGGPKSQEETWDWLCAAAGDWIVTGLGLFALEQKDKQELVGWCGLWKPFDLEEPELAWSLFPSAQGKGYATEAAQCVQQWAAFDLKLPPLFSFVHPDNTASRALAERLGAEIESEMTFRGRPRLVYRHRQLS